MSKPLLPATRPPNEQRHGEVTIAARFDPRDNALNVLRLALAAAVIVSHCQPVGGFGPDPQLGDLNLGQLAVGGFFTISGFLIATSRLNSSFADFAWRRALRIMPGFWVCLLVTAFVAAPLTDFRRGYWTATAAVRYVVEQFLLYRAGSYSIGATLTGAPYWTTWNASLWTLFYEAACYLVVGIAAFSTAFRRHSSITLAAFLVSTALCCVSYAYGTPGTLGLLATFLPWFLAGTTLLRYADRVILTWWGASVMLVLLAVMMWAGVSRLVGALPVAYLCMWAGVALPRHLRRVSARNDVSYGVYLYGFPVQQSMFLLGAHRLGSLLFVLTAVVVTIPIAWMSWVCVERPALRWKSVPTRMLARTLRGLTRRAGPWRAVAPARDSARAD